jgi:hypothetical protein
MSQTRWSVVGSALVGCLTLLTASCRNDPGATNERGADPSAVRRAPVAAADQASVLAATPSASAPGLSSPATTRPTRDNDCAGPPSGPLPSLEQRKLTAQKQGRYRFELQYPLFHEDNEKLTQKLNAQLLEHLTGIQKRFVQEAENQDVESEPDNARWLEGKCEAAYHSKSFVSVACDTMEGPGAHPNLDKLAYNFQICPELRLLALTDLCRSLPECRKRIVELINDDFRTGDKKQTGIQFRTGPVPHGESSDPEHRVAALRTFAITPTGLRFYLFDELPHVLQAFGVIDIPAAKLRPVLREDVAHRIWPS